MMAVSGVEEMIETDLIKGGGRGVGRDMTANGTVNGVGTNDHRQRIPSDPVLEFALYLAIARISALSADRKGIDVRGIGRKRKLYASLRGAGLEGLKQTVGPLRVILSQDIVQRFQPLL